MGATGALAAAAGRRRGMDYLGSPEQVQAKAERDAKSKGDVPWDFWLKPGDEAKVIFLDGDDCLVVAEHNTKGADGKWGNYSTCLKDLGQPVCPLCTAGEKSSLSWLFTILHLTSFENNKKETVVNPVRLLRMKEDQAALLKKYIERLGTLVGQQFTVSRSNKDKSARTGDQWIHDQTYDVKDLPFKKLLGKDRRLKVRTGEKDDKGCLVDWEKYIQPKSAEAMQAQAATSMAQSTADDDDAAAYDD